MTNAPLGRAAIPATSSLQQAYARCVEITRTQARNFYGAFLTLPPPARLAICAVYAYCRRLDDIADGADSLAVKESLLDKERLALRSALDGQAPDLVYAALADAVRRYSIPEAHLFEIEEGVRQDLVKARYQTIEELERYCYLVASAVGLACLAIFGYRDPAAKRAAVDLGLAMQLTNILRDVEEDADRGRIYLPLDDLEAFGVTEQDILNKQYSERFKRLMAFECERAKAYYASATILFRQLPRRSRPCPMVLMGVYRSLLRRIEASDYNVFGRRIALSGTHKAVAAAWLWVKGLAWFPPR